jgi:hypothetical protein
MQRPQLVGHSHGRTRPIAGADAVQTIEQKAKTLLAQADAHHELSSNLAHDDAS